MEIKRLASLRALSKLSRRGVLLSRVYDEIEAVVNEIKCVATNLKSEK